MNFNLDQLQLSVHFETKVHHVFIFWCCGDQACLRLRSHQIWRCSHIIYFSQKPPVVQLPQAVTFAADFSGAWFEPSLTFRLPCNPSRALAANHVTRRSDSKANTVNYTTLIMLITWDVPAPQLRRIFARFRGISTFIHSALPRLLLQMA